MKQCLVIEFCDARCQCKAVCRIFFHASDLQEYPFPMSPERFGAADEIVGSWLKDRDRSKLIIATKVS